MNNSDISTAASIAMSLDTSSSVSGNITSERQVTMNNSQTDQFRPEILEGICKLLLCRADVNDTLYSLCVQYLEYFLEDIERDRLYSQMVPTASKVVLSVMLSVIIVLSLSGNSLVVMTFIFNKYMRSVTNVFILSLAVSDLMVTVTCIPMYMGGIHKSSWIFGRFGCKMIPCITHFAVACSSLTLCCIAFDRYYAIVHPLKLKFLQTTRRAATLQAVVWCVSAASSIPYALFYDTVQVSACTVVDEANKEVCIQQHYDSVKTVFDVWVTIFVLFYGPFLFMSILYSIICYKLWIQRSVGVTSQKNNDVRLKLKRKAIKMLITVVVIFVICWSPLLLFTVVANTSHVPTNVDSLNWRSFLQCLAMSSTCWNPLVYAFMNEKFRKAFRTLLSCRKRQVHPVLVRRLSTESRKTTTQLEMPAIPTHSRHTCETKV